MHTLLTSNQLLGSLASQGDPDAFFNLFAQVIREDYSCYCSENDPQSSQKLLEFYCSAYNGFVLQGCEIDPLQWLARFKQRTAAQYLSGEAALALPATEPFERFAKMLRAQLKREFARYRLRKTQRHTPPRLTRFFILCALITTGVLGTGVIVEFILKSTATNVTLSITRGEKRWNASVPFAQGTIKPASTHAFDSLARDTSTTTADSGSALPVAKSADERLPQKPTTSTPVTQKPKKVPLPPSGAPTAPISAPTQPRPTSGGSGSGALSRNQVSSPITDNTTNAPEHKAPIAAPAVPDELPGSTH